MVKCTYSFTNLYHFILVYQCVHEGPYVSLPETITGLWLQSQLLIKNQRHQEVNEVYIMKQSSLKYT